MKTASECEKGKPPAAERFLAQYQARRLLADGTGLSQPVKHVFRIRPTGERTLHTVLTEWFEDVDLPVGWYRRPTLGDVVLGSSNCESPVRCRRTGTCGLRGRGLGRADARGTHSSATPPRNHSAGELRRKRGV